MAKEIIQEKSTKFTREYVNDNGVKDIWEYDLDKYPYGPIKTEYIYPKGSKHRDQILEEENNKLPLSKRRYNNPATGKTVGYQRAKELGLI